MKIKCLKCRDIIQGDKKGTLIRCSCEKVAIDEIEYDTRIIGNDEDWESRLNNKYRYRLIFRFADTYPNSNHNLD